MHLGDDLIGHLDDSRSSACRALVRSARIKRGPLSDRDLLTGTGTVTDPYVLRIRLPRTS